MKRLYATYALVLLILFSSCEKRVRTVYEYEKFPVFTWGQVFYFGDCYANYGIENHVLSLYAFTDSLNVNDKGQLQGFGQYIYLDDIYIAPIRLGTDTIIPAGVYAVSASREPMTIEPGKVYKGDSIRLKMDIGAQLHYIEKLERFTARRFIEDGSMTVSYTDSTIRFDMEFLLDDKTEIIGRYETTQLPVFDDSINRESIRQQILNLLNSSSN